MRVVPRNQRTWYLNTDLYSRAPGERMSDLQLLTVCWILRGGQLYQYVEDENEAAATHDVTSGDGGGFRMQID